MTSASLSDAFPFLAIPAAFALDAVLGDPHRLPHPIRWMGRAIEISEPFLRKCIKNERLAGTLFALSLILGCWAVTALATTAANKIHPLLGFGLEVVLIFFALSARSLRDAGMTIHRLLVNDDVDRARREIALIVGRDVDHYGADDIARAAVETVAENFVDGVLSPLVFAMLGGAPLAMAYKMVNTLDSMVGYKTERYRRFGWASARIDDAANFVPARLSVIVISLSACLLRIAAGGRALATALREGSHHSSPNAGFPEAAFAGALAVKLNGPNLYGGVLVDKPYIGEAFGPVRADHIRYACELMFLAAIVSLLICSTVSILL